LSLSDVFLTWRFINVWKKVTEAKCHPHHSVLGTHYQQVPLLFMLHLITWMSPCLSGFSTLGSFFSSSHFCTPKELGYMSHLFVGRINSKHLLIS
jgi:hypothetical protein